MTSLRHNDVDASQAAEGSAADLALDAARASILAVGWSRTTLTDIARRAGVSRMTIYRNWSDMSTLLADLMTREWAALMRVDTTTTSALDRLVRGVVETVRAVRANPLFARIVELDPELLLPYLLERPGRAQGLAIALIADQIRAGQAAGEIRAGDPDLLARSIVLACHGFTLSTHTMAETKAERTTRRTTGVDISEAQLYDELATLLESYLHP